MRYTGHVYDKKTGLPLSGRRVTDGRNITFTDEMGCYSLPGWERSHFVSVGVLTTEHSDWYFLSEGGEHDFFLSEYKGSEKGSSFLHISDTEIYVDNDGVGDWVDFLKNTAKEKKVDFLIHTGDICYRRGLSEHYREVNRETVGVPTRYTIGNHDYLKDADYGEQLYEELYGPTFYSFDLGGIHYAVMPIKGGDAPSRYESEDSNIWLSNDLASLPENTKTVIFCHEILKEMDDFTLKVGEETLDLPALGVKLWICGHYHNNFRYTKKGITVLSTARPDVGGIDSSPAGTRLVRFCDEPFSEIVYDIRQPERKADEPIWRTDLSGDLFYSAPVLHGDVLYAVTSSDGIPKPARLFAICANNGSIIWSLDMPTNVKRSPLVTDSMIYLADTEGNIYLIDHSGSLKKTISLPIIGINYTLRAPVKIDNRIFCGSSRSVSAISEETDEIIWQKKYIRYTVESSAHYVTDGKVLVFGTHWRAIRAVSLCDGELLWENTEARDAVASPLICGDVLYVPSRTALYKLSMKTGETVASRQYEPSVSFNTVATPLMFDGVLYVATANRGILAIDPDTLDIVREYPVGNALLPSGEYFGRTQTVASSPMILDGCLVFAAADGVIYFFDPTSCDPLREILVGEPILSDLTVADGKIYAATAKGKILAYSLC